MPQQCSRCHTFFGCRTSVCKEVFVGARSGPGMKQRGVLNNMCVHVEPVVVSHVGSHTSHTIRMDLVFKHQRTHKHHTNANMTA